MIAPTIKSLILPRQTNFVERMAVVGPSRSRELMLRQRTRERNQAESALHVGFYQTQSMKIGTTLKAIPLEGSVKRR